MDEYYESVVLGRRDICVSHSVCSLSKSRCVGLVDR